MMNVLTSLNALVISVICNNCTNGNGHMTMPVNLLSVPLESNVCLALLQMD